jgi:membrane protein DedA with SNARE-associated domain
MDGFFSGLAEQVLAFIQLHKAWIVPAVFVLALLESIAFVSLLVPSTIILAGLGTAIGAGGLPFWPPFFAAVVGAFLGDWLSYEIGRRYRTEVKNMWPLNKQPELFERGEGFFRKYGAPGYFVGRFVGPLRAVFPLICGISAMNPLVFQLTNILSAVAWAAVYLGIGAGLGTMFS